VILKTLVIATNNHTCNVTHQDETRDMVFTFIILTEEFKTSMANIWCKFNHLNMVLMDSVHTHSYTILNYSLLSINTFLHFFQLLFN